MRLVSLFLLRLLALAGCCGLVVGVHAAVTEALPGLSLGRAYLLWPGPPLLLTFVVLGAAMWASGKLLSYPVGHGALAPAPQVAPRPAPAPEPAEAPWRMDLPGLLLLAALLAAPLYAATHGPQTLLPGSAAEALAGSLWLNAWVLDWMREGGRLLYADTIFWPTGGELLSVYGAIGTAFFCAPFLALFGYPDGYLPFVWAMLLTNALAVVWLGRRLGLDRQGALLAAAAFALSPPVLTAVGQGDQLWFVVFGLPWSLGAAVGLARAPSLRAGLHLCLALFVTVLLSALQGLLAALLALAVVGAAFVLHPARRSALLHALRPALVIAVFGLALLMPLFSELHRGALPGMRSWATEGLQPQDLLEGRLVGLAVAHLTHPQALLFGSGGVDALWRGGLALLLGLALWRGPRAVSLWIAGGAAITVLGLGAGLVEGERVWPLPLAGLQVLVPPLGRLHHADRWFLLSGLLFAVALGRCWGPLLRRMPAIARRPAFGLALALILGLPWASRVAPIPTTDATPPVWLDQLGEGPIAALPIGWTDLPISWAPGRQRAWVGGPGVVRQTFGRTTFRESLGQGGILRPLSSDYQGSIDLGALAALHEAGLRYVVVDNRFVFSMADRFAGDPTVEQIFPHLMEVDRALGPALLRSGEVVIYRVPTESELRSRADVLIEAAKSPQSSAQPL